MSSLLSCLGFLGGLCGMACKRSRPLTAFKCPPNPKFVQNRFSGSNQGDPNLSKIRPNIEKKDCFRTYSSIFGEFWGPSVANLKINRWRKFWTNLGFRAFLNAVSDRSFRKEWQKDHPHAHDKLKPKKLAKDSRRDLLLYAVYYTLILSKANSGHEQGEDRPSPSSHELFRRKTLFSDLVAQHCDLSYRAIGYSYTYRIYVSQGIAGHPVLYPPKGGVSHNYVDVLKARGGGGYRRSRLLSPL